MSVIRVEKTKNYTVMSNCHLKDKNLSFKAKGLLSYMLSLPDTWDYSVEGLCKASKDNVTAVKSTLKELRENNYLEVKKILPNQSKSGRIEYEYTVFEVPKKKKQDIGFLPLEFLPTENLSTENQRLLNTKKVNTKKRKSKKEKYSYEFEKFEDNELNNLYDNKKGRRPKRSDIFNTIRYCIKNAKNMHLKSKEVCIFLLAVSKQKCKPFINLIII